MPRAHSDCFGFRSERKAFYSVFRDRVSHGFFGFALTGFCNRRRHSSPFFLQRGRRAGEGKGQGAATGTKAGGGARRKLRAAEGYAGREPPPPFVRRRVAGGRGRF